MKTHVELRSGAYADSVTLLQVSKDVAAVAGVCKAQVAMATALNLEVLESMGFTVPDEATPNDMVVALLVDEAALPAALVAVDTALSRASQRSDAGAAERAPHRTTGAALRETPGLALISVPGAAAALEAADALAAGQDVMIFSDNVPLEQEIALKQRADELGLLVMGPDCGTAVVGGVGLGFANATSPGPIGVVAASGTGSQQVLALLDAAGLGVDTAYGVGGRDLSADVGALSTKTALKRLDADSDVEQIVVVSKPPADEVAADLREFAAGLTTPVTFALLGAGQPDITAGIEQLLRSMKRHVPTWPSKGSARGARPGNLRGLFVGGTLCDEAMLIATEALGEVHSNIPLADGLAVGADLGADLDTHVMLDFGDDALTQGRAHPMIDPTLRTEHLATIGADSRTGVVLLDVVLGHGAEADPAAGLAPEIAALDVPVVVACIGTPRDPQGQCGQVAALVEAGAEVFLSNAHATRRALELIGANR